jgi:hypothetical protein
VFEEVGVYGMGGEDFGEEDGDGEESPGFDTSPPRHEHEFFPSPPGSPRFMPSDMPPVSPGTGIETVALLDFEMGVHGEAGSGGDLKGAGGLENLVVDEVDAKENVDE